MSSSLRARVVAFALTMGMGLVAVPVAQGAESEFGVEKLFAANCEKALVC